MYFNGTDNFRDLLKGQIDIIEYLNSESGSIDQIDRIAEDDVHVLAKLEPLSMNSVVNQHFQHPDSLVPNAANGAGSGMKNGVLYRQLERPPPYENRSVRFSRLPDSPPETDSGAGSAGSPSGSETSPYSPEYQNYHGGHVQGSVIHPPMGNVIQGQSNIPPGVILNVHSLDNLSQGVVGDFLTVQQNTHVTGTHVNVNYYPNQVTPSVPAPPLPVYSAYSQPVHNVQMPYPNDNSLQRKRPRADTEQMVKQEMECSDDGMYYEDGMMSHQAIRFSQFQKEQWHVLCDANGRELHQIYLHVVADKGFNYSQFDAAFVNQKKNHFQVSVHIEVRDRLPPKFVKVGNDLKPITEFQLDFYGVKAEMPSSSVQIKQSQTDRKPVTYEPVKLDLPPNRVTKVTVARLHFSETTMNNQRKNGRPNPDQKYFYLVVALHAIVQGNEKQLIIAYSSEKVIVRASNPGQFDNGESEVHWQKCQSGNAIFHPGPVGVGTDKPTSALTVSGDISCTGSVYHPSDERLKENIKEVNCADALSRMTQIRIVQYDIRPEVAEQWKLPSHDRTRVGVIAQEVDQIMPDAVKVNGEYLTVDDSRIFYESAAAVKELCRLTGNLEYKIDEVEKISKKLSKFSKLKHADSLRSSLSASTFGGSQPGSVCGNSLLSCSLTSIVHASKYSAADKAKLDGAGDGKYPKNHGRYHKHDHHYCRHLARQQGLCSTKVIHTTIIMLVIVMAFCLISMATLYILDWHKRNIVGTSKILTLPVSNGRKGADGPVLGGKHRNELGLMSIEVTTMRQSLTVPHDPDWMMTIPPPLSPCTKLFCEQFCCPHPHSPYSYRIDSVDPSIGTEDPMVVLMQKKSAPPVGKDFGHKAVISYKIGEDHATLAKNTKRVKKFYWGSMKNNTDAVFFKRFARDVDWQFPSVITIQTLNTTVDQRYCFGHQCDDLKRGNFTYFIPVSKYMPHIPLEIQFSFGEKEQLQYCSKEVDEYCYGIGVDYSDKSMTVSDGNQNFFANEVHQKGHDTWELPVGIYVLSAYKFRIGSSTTVCFLPEDEAGASFIEYNLVFFRTCVD